MKIQTPIETITKKFINLYKYGGMNKSTSAVILFNCARTDADNDSGRGNMISAKDSYINGNAEP